MKNAFQRRCFVRFQYIIYIIKCFTTVDNYGQFVFQRPLYLLLKNKLLFFQESFVPIEIHADFTDCHIIIRHCQMFGHNGQLFLIIGIYRSRMQPHHRKAISFVLRTNTKHGLYGRTIDVGHEDMSYSRCLSACHHLLQIRLEFIQKKVGM